MDRKDILNRIDELEKELKELKENISKKNPFQRAEKGEAYYCITSDGYVVEFAETNCDFDNRRFNIANYCTNKNLIEQINKQEILNRKLLRFSMENGGEEIDWTNHKQTKYYIYINYHLNEITCSDIRCHREINSAYFISEKVCKDAIELFKEEIEEAYNIKCMN